MGDLGGLPHLVCQMAPAYVKLVPYLGLRAGLVKKQHREPRHLDRIEKLQRTE